MSDKIPLTVKIDPEILDTYKKRVKLLDVGLNEHLSGVIYSYLDKTLYDYFLPVKSFRSKVSLQLSLDEKVIDVINKSIRPMFNKWRWKYNVKTVDEFIEGVLHGWLEFICNVGKREDGKMFIGEDTGKPHRMIF